MARLTTRKVLNHAGEGRICFIRIAAKDPLDDKLELTVIHAREEVRYAAMYTMPWHLELQ